jgi:hypothetical protein
LALVNADKRSGILLLREPPSARTAGEHILVQIRPISKDKTAVEVKTDHAGPGQFEWSLNVNKVFKGIALNLSKGEGTTGSSDPPAVRSQADASAVMWNPLGDSKGQGVTTQVSARAPAGRTGRAPRPEEELTLEEFVRRERQRRDEAVDSAEIYETQQRLQEELYLKEKLKGAGGGGGGVPAGGNR